VILNIKLVLVTVLQVTAYNKSRKLAQDMYLSSKIFEAILVPTRRSTPWLAAAPSYDKDDLSFCLTTSHHIVTKLRISEVVRQLPPYAFMACA